LKVLLLILDIGVYVFVNDSCQACSDYAKTLEKINSNYLYIVECILASEKEIIKTMFNKAVFPLTVTIDKYNILVVEPGILFEKQMAEIFKTLDYFEKNKISDEEINIIIDHYNNKCVNVFYIMPKYYENNNEIILKKLKDLKLIGLNYNNFINIELTILFDIIENMSIVIFKDENKKIYSINDLQIISEMKNRNKKMKIIEL
jgi:hypothetical protein